MSVTVIKYPSNKQLMGKRVDFSSQFQVPVYHYGEVTEAGA